LICAAHYSGGDAVELARQVVMELRNRHRMTAYIFNHADEARLAQKARLEQLQKAYPGVNWRRRIMVRVEDQCAVLIGGFKDFDSASEAVKNVKKLPLPTLKLANGMSAYDMVNLYEPDPETKRMIVKRAPVNPFSNALVVRNPLIPLPPKQTPRFDPFLTKLNDDEDYSLLKCPRPWTLIVKEYNTTTYLQGSGKTTGFLSMLGLGDRPGERLSASGAQAHELAKFLRDPRLGFKAYVLHTRRCSLVTVGEFTGPNDPELERTQRRLASLRFSTGNGGQADPIGLLPTPVPYEIPRP
jgi:hypothetical protein